MLRFEREFWKRAPRLTLAGVDEAGRGPWAGPVVAAVFSLPPEQAESAFAGPLCGLTDSKLLSPARRAHFDALIRQLPDCRFALGCAQAAEIDDLGILSATRLAMCRAIRALPGPAVDHVLLDGRPLKGLPCPSTAIVKGDRLSLLIAAASVLAKVCRDQTLQELDRRYPQYGFAAHKGYGTRQHMAQLLAFGPCPEHRQGFRPVADVAALRAQGDVNRAGSTSGFSPDP